MLLKVDLQVPPMDQLDLPGNIVSVFAAKIIFTFFCRREFSFDPTTLEPDLCKVDLEVF